MELFQDGGGGAVVGAAGEPGAEPDPVVVAHGRGRLVADAPAGGRQPPDEVDVLAHEHAVGESRPGRRPAHDERRAGHVGHPRARPDDRGPGAHVEGRARALVPGQPRGPRLMRHDPRRDRADGRVREVRQQPVQPARLRHAVRVEERDDLGRSGRQPGVPRRPRAAVDRPTDHPRAVRGGDRGDRARVGRGVVHDDDDGARSPGAVGRPGRAPHHRVGFPGAVG
jgi:hypothetical protein